MRSKVRGQSGKRDDVNDLNDDGHDHDNDDNKDADEENNNTSTNNYYIAKSNVLLDFYNSTHTYTLVASTTEFSFSCQVYFRRGVVFSVCYFSPKKICTKYLQF